ncbi:MAG: MazG family protein [Chloroflexota bacterium]|nr:MazG family protein [Chloroflexota bacterium]
MTDDTKPAAGIVVVGLGPGDPDLRTVGAQRRLAAAERIVLRTARHPGLNDLNGDGRVVSCDDLYEAGDTFEEVYEAIARRVCDVAVEATGLVVYAVPGHPRFGERTVELLRQEADRRHLTLTVEAAVSAFDAIATAIDADLMADQVQVLDAAALLGVLDEEPFAGGLVGLDPSRSALVCQVYAQHVASAVKLTLGRLYPDDHPIVIVRAAGVQDGEMLEPCRLFELDRRRVDHLTSVWIPALPPMEATRSPFTLQRIVARLRAPGGCPWDRTQTHATLRDAIIEEAYETVDAIDAGDSAHLAEELGDLLLIVAMHAQIAEEAGDFALEDIYDHVSRKLVRRHPHVFGDARADTPDEVVTTWNAVKAAERAAAGPAGASPESSPLAKLPRSMPALHMARVLFGARKGDASVAGNPGRVTAIGDALLATARQAAEAGIDPEHALRLALRRSVEANELAAAERSPKGSVEA